MQLLAGKMLKQVQYNKRKGFTLAEVLVTLAIIGVVASLTIPALVKNTQETQFKTAWKETFSILSQATLMVAADNGGTMQGLCAVYDYNCMISKYNPYLKTIKTCPKYNAKAQGCWHADNTVKYLNGNDINVIDESAGIILINGALVIPYWESQNCSQNTGSLPYNCGFFYVDVNGFKSPNTVGKDIFRALVYRNNRLIPEGSQNTLWVPPLSTCIDGDASAANNGWYCSYTKFQ